MNNLVIITSFLDLNFQVSELTSKSDFIICIDGGYDIALSHGITPDFLMGDFDSITSELPEKIPTERFLPEKDYTDLELALKKAMELKAKNVTVVGGIGGRLDHTIANIQLLSSYAGKFNNLTMMDGRNKCFIMGKKGPETMTVKPEEDSYISLFSLSDECLGITFDGVKYPLRDHTLTRDFPLGVSNEFAEKDAVLTIENGTLLVVISKK